MKYRERMKNCFKLKNTKEAQHVNSMCDSIIERKKTMTDIIATISKFAIFTEDQIPVIFQC